MIVFHTVVRSRPIPLINYRLDTNHKPIPFYSKSCCGECRGSGLLNTTEKECRCTDFESYSTSCRCITLRDGIFFVSTAIRQEALKHYWKENTFIYQGKIDQGNIYSFRRLVHCPFGQAINRSFESHFRTIRHIIIETRTNLAADPNQGDWRSYTQLLNFFKNWGGPQLRVGIRLPYIRPSMPMTFLISLRPDITSKNREDFKRMAQKSKLKLRVFISHEDGSVTKFLDQ